MSSDESKNASHGIADLYKLWNQISEILALKFLIKMWRKFSTWPACVKWYKCSVKRKLSSDKSQKASHGIADYYKPIN